MVTVAPPSPPLLLPSTTTKKNTAWRSEFDEVNRSDRGDSLDCIFVCLCVSAVIQIDGVGQTGGRTGEKHGMSLISTSYRYKRNSRSRVKEKSLLDTRHTLWKLCLSSSSFCCSMLWRGLVTGERWANAGGGQWHRETSVQRANTKNRVKGT